MPVAVGRHFCFRTRVRHPVDHPDFEGTLMKRVVVRRAEQYAVVNIGGPVV
jgi:hypothetical protein